MKPILCALALCAMLAPARAQDVATAPVAAPYVPTIQLDSGIRITPVLRPASDLEQMTDVHFWQFQLQLPAANTFTSARLELRAPGKPTQLVSDNRTFLQHNADLLVGIAPIASESLSMADKWKVYCRLQETSKDSHKLGFSSASTHTPANLLKELRDLSDLKYRFQIISYGNGGDYALPQANGDIPLITVYGKDSGDEPTLTGELILVLTYKPAATN